MNRRLGSVVVLMTLGFGQAAQAAESIGELIDETKFMVNWRVRSEAVEQTGFAEEAQALTSRIRAGFESGTVAGTRLLAEMSATSELSSDYNSTTNGQTAYPVVADPGGFATINRFAFINNSLDKTSLSLGRQRLILDDSRFVGNVGWRQHEQTYDGLVSQTSGTKFSASFAWFDQVNRVFGPQSPQGKWHGDIVLLNGSRTFGFGKVTAFAYGLEIDEAVAASTETIGLRLSGSRAFGDTSLLYTLSWATQSEAGANTADLDLDYVFLEAGFTRGKFTTALGYEVLSGNGTTSFSTPLATLHAFQGWADKFLATPGNGIVDSFIRFAYSPGMNGPFDSVSLAAWYHQFDADFGSATYGDELDFSIAARVDRITLTLKYAVYEAEGLFTDTDKLWFSMDFAL